MHLAQVISDQVSQPGALPLVVHLAQLPERFHLHQIVTPDGSAFAQYLLSCHNEHDYGVIGYLVSTTEQSS